MIAPATDESLDDDQPDICEALLYNLVDRARTVMEVAITPGARCVNYRKDGKVFGALVIAQAIVKGASITAIRLERIADTLDDLVEAIERKTEGGEV